MSQRPRSRTRSGDGRRGRNTGPQQPARRGVPLDPKSPSFSPREFGKFGGARQPETRRQYSGSGPKGVTLPPAGFDLNQMFHHILTVEDGFCTVQDLADGLGIDSGPIPEFVVKHGSSRMKLVQAAFPEKALVVAILYNAHICTFQDNCTKPDCHFFHLCKNFVVDSCNSGSSCEFSHDIDDAHNRRVVRSSGLSTYQEEDILHVIRNSQPEICLEYNQPSGCRALQTGDACHKFHICLLFVKGKCLLPNCRMDHHLASSHNIMLKVCLPKNDKILMKMMLFPSDEDDAKSPLMSTPRVLGSALPSGPRGLGANVPRKPICHHNIERLCRYDKKTCRFDHSYDLPYMWCINLNDDWYPMQDVNTTIERAFSQPDKKRITVQPQIVKEILEDDVEEMKIKLKDMQFPLMTCPVTYLLDGEKKSTEVVRLSTKSYVQDISFGKNGKDGFVTVWKWYWKDNDGWKLYGEEGNPPHQDGIESQFLARTEEMEFSYGRFSYTLYPQKGYQQNKDLGTKRDVQRRPVFVPESGVKDHKYPSMPLRTCDPKAIKEGKKEADSTMSLLPDGWRSMKADSFGYDLVSLSSDSSEYREVKQHFFKTIPSSYRIIEIQRVQNPLLYKDLVSCRATLKVKYKGSTVEEQDLFHGTKALETAKSICFQGFDPRIHAVTAYGKGAYFARDASYSDRYAGSSCCMFRSKVIVGKYTNGTESMQRPPPLPGCTYELYDSTVNSASNPAIYVVYDKAQCYPSHLITYKRE